MYHPSVLSIVYVHVSIYHHIVHISQIYSIEESCLNEPVPVLKNLWKCHACSLFAEQPRHTVLHQNERVRKNTLLFAASRHVLCTFAEMKYNKVSLI